MHFKVRINMGLLAPQSIFFPYFYQLYKHKYCIFCIINQYSKMLKTFTLIDVHVNYVYNQDMLLLTNKDDVSIQLGLYFLRQLGTVLLPD